jgi:ADP-ribosylglycohydrolase
MSNNLQSKFRGCLVGAAIGDALGMGYVGCSAADIQARRGGQEFMPGDISTVTVVVPVGELGTSQIGQPLASGQWTEDIQLMLALAESLIEEGGYFIPESWSHALVRWVNAEPRQPGISSIQAALQLRTGGVFWDESADPEGAGSGAAARTAPIGLLFCSDASADDRRGASVVQAQVTHGHPDAQAAALTMSEAVATLTAISPADLHNWHGVGFLRGLTDVLARASDQFEEFGRCVSLAANLLADGVERSDAIRVIGSTGWCREAVPCALYILASAPEDPESLISDSVRLTGAATDTIGAMVGALTGALHGLSALPKRWRADVEDYAHIIEVADALTRLQRRAS